jgi:hypothetical protein
VGWNNLLIKDQMITPLEISSVEDGVYRALRSELEAPDLELAPGQRLPLEEIAGRFQVSLTPVRRLRRLESRPSSSPGAAPALHRLRRGAEEIWARGSG